MTISSEAAIDVETMGSREAQANGPRCAVIFIASVYDWLYRAMIPMLRERFGTRFIILTRGDLWKGRYGDIAAPNDRIVDMNVLETQWLAANEAPEEVFREAQDLEREYGLVYMRDILQQERSLATRFLGNAPFHAHGQQYEIDLVGLTRQINGYFRRYESLLRDEKVDLVFSRPDSLSGVPLTAVAEKMGILCTFPDVAKYKDLITWAYGAYRGDAFLHAAYERLASAAPTEVESANAVRYADRDFVQPDAATRLSSIAKRFSKFLLIRAAMLAEDVRDWQFGRRTSFWTEVRRFGNTYRAGRWLDRRVVVSATRASKLPYVLYLLPVEPEFNTHSLAREFNNSLAIAQQLALCLPSGYRLIVKEHGSNIGNRKIEYYEQLERLPNVEFADHRVPGTVLAANAAALVTISGTIGMEASLLGKQVVTFSKRTIYDFLPHVHAVTSFFDLPAAIASAVAPRSEAEVAEIKKAGARFYSAIRAIGFSAPESPLFKGSQTVLSPESAKRALEVLLQVHAMQSRESKSSRNPGTASRHGQ